MESQLPVFKEKNPQLEVVTELIRGQHPHLKGFYSKFVVLTCNCVTNFLFLVSLTFLRAMLYGILNIGAV